MSLCCLVLSCLFVVLCCLIFSFVILSCLVVSCVVLCYVVLPCRVTVPVLSLFADIFFIHVIFCQRQAFVRLGVSSDCTKAPIELEEKIWKFFLKKGIKYLFKVRVLIGLKSAWHHKFATNVRLAVFLKWNEPDFIRVRMAPQKATKIERLQFFCGYSNRLWQKSIFHEHNLNIWCIIYKFLGLS